MGSPRDRAGAVVRVAVVLAACAAGALAALGCAIAIVFEVDGFATKRTGAAQWLYVGALVLGAAAAIALPGLLWRALLPRSAPATGLVLVLALLGAAAVLGLGLAR